MSGLFWKLGSAPAWLIDFRKGFAVKGLHSQMHIVSMPIVFGLYKHKQIVIIIF